MRKEALRDPKQSVSARVLDLCDALQNKELPQVDIQVEDLEPGQSVVKILSLAELEAALEDIDLSKCKAVAKGDGQDELALRNKQEEFEALLQIAPVGFAQEVTGVCKSTLLAGR